jgi:glycyl-tRNA synthetase
MLSLSLYEPAALRFWDEAALRRRDALVADCAGALSRALCDLNPAWTFHRCEGPILTPREHVSPAYDDSDLFVTNHKGWVARAETTASSYAYAEHLMKHGAKGPLCVWQLGRSFRREQNDGATSAKLRFNEFHQLEFQAIYRADSKADYRTAGMIALLEVLAWHTRSDLRVVDSDRLPSYSQSTKDFEAAHNGAWREIASCSIRTDFAFGPHELRVAEFAIGVDRVLEVGAAHRALMEGDGV